MAAIQSFRFDTSFDQTVGLDHNKQKSVLVYLVIDQKDPDNNEFVITLKPGLFIINPVDLKKYLESFDFVDRVTLSREKQSDESTLYSDNFVIHLFFKKVQFKNTYSFSLDYLTTAFYTDYKYEKAITASHWGEEDKSLDLNVINDRKCWNWSGFIKKSVVKQDDLTDVGVLDGLYTNISKTDITVFFATKCKAYIRGLVKRFNDNNIKILDKTYTNYSNQSNSEVKKKCYIEGDDFVCEVEALTSKAIKIGSVNFSYDFMRCDISQTPTDKIIYLCRQTDIDFEFTDVFGRNTFISDNLIDKCRDCGQNLQIYDLNTIDITPNLGCFGTPHTFKDLPDSVNSKFNACYFLVASSALANSIRLRPELISRYNNLHLAVNILPESNNTLFSFGFRTQLVHDDPNILNDPNCGFTFVDSTGSSKFIPHKDIIPSDANSAFTLEYNKNDIQRLTGLSGDIIKIDIKGILPYSIAGQFNWANAFWSSRYPQFYFLGQPIDRSKDCTIQIYSYESSEKAVLQNPEKQPTYREANKDYLISKSYERGSDCVVTGPISGFYIKCRSLGTSLFNRAKTGILSLGFNFNNVDYLYGTHFPQIKSLVLYLRDTKDCYWDMDSLSNIDLPYKVSSHLNKNNEVIHTIEIERPPFFDEDGYWTGRTHNTYFTINLFVKKTFSKSYINMTDLAAVCQKGHDGRSFYDSSYYGQQSVRKDLFIDPNKASLHASDYMSAIGTKSISTLNVKPIIDVINNATFSNDLTKTSKNVNSKFGIITNITNNIQNNKVTKLDLIIPIVKKDITSRLVEKAEFSVNYLRDFEVYTTDADTGQIYKLESSEIDKYFTISYSEEFGSSTFTSQFDFKKTEFIKLSLKTTNSPLDTYGNTVSFVFYFNVTREALNELNSLSKEEPKKYTDMLKTHLDIDSTGKALSTDSTVLSLNLNTSNDIRFIHYETKNALTRDIAKSDTDLLNTNSDIVFVKDSKEIFTHDTYYGSGNADEQNLEWNKK